jgi:hypothetical protein
VLTGLQYLMKPSKKPFENGLVNTFSCAYIPYHPDLFRRRVQLESFITKSIFWLSWNTGIFNSFEIVSIHKSWFPRKINGIPVGFRQVFLKPEQILWDNWFCIRTKNQINHPTEKITGIFLHLVKPSDNFFLGRLNSAVGAPKCWSAKYILFCNCMNQSRFWIYKLSLAYHSAKESVSCSFREKVWSLLAT